MTVQSSNDPQNNNEIANEYLKKMNEDLADAKNLIEKLESLGKEYAFIKAFIQTYGPILGILLPGLFTGLLAELKVIQSQISDTEKKLTALDPAFKDFDSAINAIEQGMVNVFSDGDANLSEDLQMFDDMLSKILTAALDKMEVDLYEKEMKKDGNDNKQLLKDALAMMKASSEENGALMGLQGDLSKDLEKLNKQAADAGADLSKYHWYNSWLHEGTIAHDHAIIRNAQDMEKVIDAVMKDIAPEIAASQNAIYESATLSLNNIEKRIIKILNDINLNPEEKLKQIKVLLALALGILSQIQSDAAKEKSEDNQTMVKSANYTVQENIDNQKAAMIRLENELKYASIMGKIMKIAKPLMEAGGIILAACTGNIAALFVMAALIVSDNTGATQKLTDELKKHMSSLAADFVVGGIETILAVASGGAGAASVNNAAAKAATTAVEAAGETIETTVTQIAQEAGEQAVQLAQEQAAQAGEELSGAAVEQIRAEAMARATEIATPIVESGVTQAAGRAAAGTVRDIDRQLGAAYIKKLLTSSGGISDRIVMVAKENCAVAAKEAERIAAQNISVLAKAAVNGADVSAQEVAVVAKDAANEAIAGMTDSSAEEVASRTAKTSVATNMLASGSFAAAYNAFNDGAVSYGIEQAMKASGASDKSIEIVMDIMKVLEQIAAMLCVMYGTGLMDSMSFSSSGSTMLKLGAMSQTAGMGLNSAAQLGQADAANEQAGTVEAITKESVSNNMMQMFTKQFFNQAALDEKHAQNQLAEQASNFTMISQLENNWQELAKVLETQVV